MTAESDKDSFDLNKVSASLGESKTPDGQIILKHYIEGYRELIKLFAKFGKVFGFVISDIESKLKILGQHLDGENGKKYETVQSMIDFEVAEKITISKTKLPSGSRTLLRLHRALKFIILLLGKLTEIESDAYLSGPFCEAYRQSLAEFHTWIVRKMVEVALMTLSTKSWMLQKISPTLPEDEVVARLKETVTIAQPIYDIIQDVYTEKDLHGLP